MIEEVSGKQVLSEFETLLKDTGMYMFCVGRRIVRAVKKAAAKHDKSEGDGNAPCETAVSKA